MRKRKPSHPGLILRHHYLMPLGLSITEVSAALGISRKTLSKIINCRASITPDIALRLSKAFNTSAVFWLNLQQTYNLWQAARNSTDWKKVHKFKIQTSDATA